MNIKSLLIGSASAAVLSTSALAADAVVYADPEPMEYVRICDVYGAGFFYIPGTETCMRIGGYVRFQTNFTFNAPSGYTTLARFAPNIDVRSSSDWGTIRAFGEVEFDYGALTAAQAALIGLPGAGYYNTTALRHAFIDIGDRNFLRIGRNWSPYGVYVGPGGNVADGSYGRRTVNAVAYYFNTGQLSGVAGGGIAPGQGISGFIALVDNERTNNWNTDVEAGLGYGWQGGYLRGAVAYDSRGGIGGGDAWSARLGVQHAFGALTARLVGLYNSRPDLTSLGQNYSLGATAATGGSRWSLIGGLDYTFNPKAKANLTVQWFNQTVFNVGTAAARWTVAAGVDLTPATGLRIRPEINYRNNYNNTSAWGGVIRVDRTF